MVYFVTLSLVAAALAFDSDRRCLLHDRKCVSHCPRNMYAYHTKCDGRTTSQRTCDTPLIHVLGYTCGWSRCDCSGDLVLDEQTGYCIQIDDCPMYPIKLPKNKANDRRRSGRQRYHVSKRVKIEEDELNDLN